MLDTSNGCDCFETRGTRLIHNTKISIDFKLMKFTKFNSGRRELAISLFEPHRRKGELREAFTDILLLRTFRSFFQAFILLAMFALIIL